MIEFEEPEKDYVFEGSNLTGKKPKIRLVVLLLTFFIVIGFFVKNDYDFNFFKSIKPVLEFQCTDEVTYNNHEDKIANYERAKKALAMNIVLIKSKCGFIDDSISFEKIKRINVMKPVINLTFAGEIAYDVPEKMCDFKVNALYK